MKVLIIANGDINDYIFLEEQIQEHSFIICADGAARHLVALKLKPNLLMGDFDSISKKDMEWMVDAGVNIEQFPARKDQTDTDIALDYGISLKPELITIIGCMGSRWDHSLGNVMLLNKLLEAGIKGVLRDESNMITITNNKLVVEGMLNDNVSIIPLTTWARGVTLEGMEYPLFNHDIKMGTSIGISNRLLNNRGQIIVREGILLVIQSREESES